MTPDARLCLFDRQSAVVIYLRLTVDYRSSDDCRPLTRVASRRVAQRHLGRLGLHEEGDLSDQFPSISALL